MEKFVRVTGIAAPIPINNVDTDMITPKQVLKAVTRKGLAWSLFQEHRFRPDGSENPDFVLNKEPWRNATIIVSLENWGCGSSREHSPWAMYDFGIRAVVAISFADIHYNNCFKNGILPVTLAPEEIDRVMRSAEAGEAVTVDLERKRVSLADGTAFGFEIEDYRRDALLRGLDEIGQTLDQAGAITAFEDRQREITPWLYDRTVPD
ncbi:3-isopropylmalate dehydratase small subunit [Fulvimarina sp. 2208YS6-2-32]|uniref:3-isopropylmalate dehydratase small subunit n=1 Tax=Fulvimarina uroteuthidis TaxID=3098149 RepID=A0ABU5I1U6_9HYPH|nr:3-isopropylmalate dehydratase small subunit [Fulvimarina sp. 2208YS6-2-32]MDY8109295.1 3-isopropylmalate dehydratase small subunit [Fulvimarina sp. 2208YS6-2-32]